jgi:hypothetical protein
MDESEPEPIPEKPRYLLPEGCKDLYDVIQQRKGRAELLAGLPFPKGAGKIDLSKLPAGFPATVQLPGSITVVKLAEAIHVPLLHLLIMLPQWGVDTALSQPLDFSTAKALCFLYGVEASLAD